MTKTIKIIIAVAIAAITVSAQTFKMTGGEAEAISVGDTLVVSDEGDVTIHIESNSKILVKGGSSISIGGGGGAVSVTLDDGQIFIDRNAPHGLSSVSVRAKGLTFTPVGTAAAFKTTPQGAPTVAVLRGEVRVADAQGGTLTVGPRQFGTVNSAGRLAIGDLNDRGLAQLETWSGVRAESVAESAGDEPVMMLAQASELQPEQPSTQVYDDGAAQMMPSQGSPPPSLPASTEEPEEIRTEGSVGRRPQESTQTQTQTPTTPPSAALPPGANQVIGDDEQQQGGYQPEDPSAKTAAAAGGDEEDRRRSPRGSGPTPIFSKPGFEVSAGVATVNNEPWTRLAIGIDLPIWKFGVFLDLELFIDPESRVSDKGWDFRDNTADAIFRKIRYVRFGYEEDPLFVKFGGLSNVTLGYGMIMDRFTNMLHYPDEKLLGLQFYLNDISSLGVSLQTLISDFAETSDDGGLFAARLAVRPLKTTGIPIINGLTVGGTYAFDRNTYAPARKWGVSDEQRLLLAIRDSSWFDSYRDIYQTVTGNDPGDIIDRADEEQALRDTTRLFGLWGVDVGVPIINTRLLNLTVYGQFAARADSVAGWGLGAPGVSAKFWRLWANAEYRKIEGRFTPGFFDAYYLDERLSRPTLQDKSQYIDSVSLNGIYGRLGMDVFGILQADGSMQYMVGKNVNDGTVRDRRYEATLGIGENIMQHIPMIDRAEVYIRNSNIGMPGNYRFDDSGVMDTTGKKAGFFDRTPYMYWGYRTGFQITKGASLVWDYRYGYKIENGRLVPDNRMFLQTALRF